MSRFRYRYVRFGTKFTVVDDALRVASPGAGGPPDGDLLANEIAADVGGECCSDAAGSERESAARMIFDHHFQREAQFPSAAAAVLHHAERVKEWSDRLPGRQPVWLVTHQLPDFDAFCSLFLLRGIVEGTIPSAGWQAFGIRPGAWQPVDEKTRRIDWFAPSVSPYEENRLPYVWPLLLAAYASRVDNCRPIMARRSRATHSVLYAGIKRGRAWEPTGAQEFFNAVVRAICERRLNPLFDDVFIDVPTLAAELALLDGEEQRYLRDLSKARKAIVSVQVAPFEEWSPRVSPTPLIDEQGKINPIHLSPGRAAVGDANSDGQATRSAPGLTQLDGIYVRDPECLLFKEWARTDYEHSPMGSGFLFTAVANSMDRPNSDSRNTSDYFFSLDPERAGDAHLYNVWARLQGREMVERTEFNPPASRRDFEGRTVGLDPWFDGNNYRATIIATPNRGTRIEPELKGAPDLSDDRVAALVAEELEYASFGGDGEGFGASTMITVWDFLTVGAAATAESTAAAFERREAVRVSQAVDHPLRDDALRFVAVPLRGADLSSRAVATEIGRKIWPFLEDAGIHTVATDFSERHLIIHPRHVAVWNRNGIVVAYTEQGQKLVSRLARGLEQLAGILRALRSRTDREEPRPLQARLRQGVELERQIMALKMEAATPPMLPFRRLLESRRFDAVLSSMQSLDQREFHELERRGERDQKLRDDRLQITLAVVAFFGLLFGWNQIEALQLRDLTAWQGAPLIRLLIGVVIIVIVAVVVPLGLRRRFRERSSDERMAGDVTSSRGGHSFGPRH
jgi:hypothetical protein